MHLDLTLGCNGNHPDTQQVADELRRSQGGQGEAALQQPEVRKPEELQVSRPGCRGVVGGMGEFWSQDKVHKDKSL